MKIPLVLLPGMMCDMRLFAPQQSSFKGEVEVIVPALVGADSMEGLAALLLADLPERFALGGVSMGGILCMEIMRQAADRVTHLALIDTNPYAERDEVRQRRGPQIEAVQAGKLKAVMRDEMKPNYFTHRRDSQDLQDLCMEMAIDLGDDAFVSQSLALRDRPDYETVLRDVSCPSLILCGRHDVLCPVQRHQDMHAMIPHSRLLIIEAAGHLPTIEEPDVVTKALRDLLEIHHG